MKKPKKCPPIKIAPSLLAGDFGHIADEVQRIEAAGADFLHLDVMDGHFVHNLTMGPQIVAAVNRSTSLFLDVHLMIYNPYEYIERFVESGADSICFHFEATEDVEDTLKYIKKCGIKAGLAFNPETSLSLIPKYLDKCDKLLLMTVDPGFGGQKLIPEVLEKVQFSREVADRYLSSNPHRANNKQENSLTEPLSIQIDGGVTLENVAECVKAGANYIVAGTSLFRAPNLKEAISEMRRLAEAAQ